LKIVKLALAMALSFALIVSICPLAQADDSKAEVELKVEVVPPVSVTTLSAWPVGWRMALLHGRLDDMGTSSSVNVYFEWGETTDYGSMTKVRRMTHTGRFSALVGGLSPGTTYHFRTVAVGEVTSYGSDETFSTKKHWWWPWW